MTEDAQNLARLLVQLVQDQTVDSARDFLGASLGWLKDRLRDVRSQLEYMTEQLRQEEAWARIQELVDSYSAIEEAARDLGLEDTIDETAPHAPSAEKQDAGGQAVQGAQDGPAGAVDQATGTAGELAGGRTDRAGSGEPASSFSRSVNPDQANGNP
jgi:hypothetical protein